MKNGFPLVRIFLVVAVTVSLAACAGTPPSRFYTVNPMVSMMAEKPSASAAKLLAVSIAPVEIPDFLERPQIVTRNGQNVLILAEYDRWAGSLAENISAVLAENLAQFLGTDRVFVFPRMQAAKPDYSVVTRILRLDCVPGNQVLLKVQWTLVAGAERKDVATHVSTFSEKLADSRYETMVTAISRTLEQLSREISREIIDRQKVAAENPAVQANP